MTDSAAAKCGNCAKTKSDSGNDLKFCARCHVTPYCSKECQKSNWKAHKKICGGNAASAGSQGSSTSAADGAPLKGLAVAIDKPFHRLDDKTWLHNRPEGDVFALLIDTYRLRVEDDYTFTGDVDVDSLYGGRADGRRGLRRFLRLAEKRGGLLPSWWSREKAAECERAGLNGGWSSLRSAIEKSDVIEHYGNRLMPMQLRMFGEQVYGSVPWRQNGDEMRQALMMAERGEGMASVIDTSSLFGQA